MKKNTLLVGCLIILFSISVSAQAESIKANDIKLEVLNDGTLKVNESIIWSFDEGVEKHGIIRDIPISKVPGSSKDMVIDNFYVNDEDGNSYNFSNTDSFSEKSYKIGDADILVSGDKKYNISYDVKNSLGYFKDFTEIYWNIVGTSWNVQSQKVSARILLPPGVDPKSIKIYCGFEEQKEECADYVLDKNNIIITVKDQFLPIPAGYGITAAVAFPRGFIYSEPTQIEMKTRELLHYASYILYFIPLLIVFLFNRKKINRRRKWKNYLKSNPIVVQYDADGFSPVQAGILYTENSDYRMMSSEITFLIAEGYIEAKEDKDGQTIFTRLPRSNDLLLPHQKILLEELSDKGELEIKLSFFETIGVVFEGIDDNLKHRNVIENKGSSKLNKFSSANQTNLFLSLFLAINPGVFIWFILGWHIGYIWSASCVLIGLASILFKNKYKLDYTEKGLQAKWYISGLHKYIDMAEKDKISFDANPEKSLDIAEKLLPYAMVFGMEKKWIAYLTKMLDLSGLANTDIGKYNYHSSVITSFASQSLLINSFSTSVMPPSTSSSSSSFSSSSSGSSSGSSGGGGGGGGGSSW